MKPFLEHFAAVIGSITIVILAMSLCHEYGYFWSIGPQFQTLLTTSDYFANGVLWLPFGLFAAHTWIDWWRLKEEPTPPMNWKKKSTWIWTLIGAITFGSVLVTFTWPVEWFNAINMTILAVMLWSQMWRSYAAPFEKLEEPLTYSQDNLFGWVRRCSF